MATAASGPLLRSAPMREFNALGSVGRPVFDSAPQVRATIRRQLGADIAAMLAVPQIGESGKDVDWYAPEGGLVVPWSAASPEERDTMRAQLQAAREKVAQHAASVGVQLSARPAQTGTDDFEVYARLLPHVMRIPNESHIYSVDGKPVLTFWGFSDPRLPDADPIRDLMPAVPAAQAAAMMPPPPEPATVARPWWARWWWWLLLLLLLLLLLWGLRTCAPEILPPAFRSEIVGEQKQPDVPPTREVPPVGTVVVPGVTVPGVVVPGEGNGVAPDGTAVVPDSGAVPPDAGATPPQPDDASKSPEDQKTPPQPDDAAKPPEATPPQDQQTPPQPDAGANPQAKPETPLTIPPQAKTGGGTDFLNGKWTSRGGLMDSRTGLPATVEYDFKGGKGTVTIKRGDGTTCVGASSATMQGGKLVITGQDDPRCSDGSSYGRATVECAQGASGAAKCSGKPQQGPEYSVDMTR